MRRVCYLHFGPHKAASTSIQNLIYANVDRLAEAGLYVTRTATHGYRRHQYAIAHELIGQPGATVGHIAALVDEVADAGSPERIIVTSENFSRGITRPDTRRRMLDLFAGMGYELRTFAFVRPQEALINSVYAQWAKTFQPTGTLPQFLAGASRQVRFDYTRFLLPVFRESEFGLTVRPLVPGSAAYRTFLDWLGVPTDAQSAFAVPAVANRTPGPRTIALCERVRDRFGPRLATLPRRARLQARKRMLKATDEAGWNDSAYFGLDTRQVEEIQARYASSNQEFSRAVWGMDWTDVFPLRTYARSVFDPESASAIERSQFDAMVERVWSDLDGSERKVVARGSG